MEEWEKQPRESDLEYARRLGHLIGAPPTVRVVDPRSPYHGYDGWVEKEHGDQFLVRLLLFPAFHADQIADAQKLGILRNMTVPVPKALPEVAKLPPLLYVDVEFGRNQIVFEKGPLSAGEPEPN
jgi:hypothetical protein